MCIIWEFGYQLCLSRCTATCTKYAAPHIGSRGSFGIDLTSRAPVRPTNANNACPSMTPRILLRASMRAELRPLPIELATLDVNAVLSNSHTKVLHCKHGSPLAAALATTAVSWPLIHCPCHLAREPLHLVRLPHRLVRP